MIQIALCDDNQESLTFLDASIREFQKTHHAAQDMTIELFHSGLDLLDTIKRGTKYDLIFLDIVMPLTDGMEVAREIRLMDHVVKIIFLTSSPDFALESYDVRAYSYVMKSASNTRLHAVLSSFMEEYVEVSNRYFVIKTKTGLMKMHYHNIEFVEVNGRNITLQMTNNKSYEVFGTLTELEDLFLSRESFIKPHRSYIVNMDHVRKLHEKELKTMSGFTVPISRANYPEVKKRYLAYSFKHGV